MAPTGQRILRNMFGLDYRSLALLRIGLGIMLLINLSITIPICGPFTRTKVCCPACCCSQVRT